MTDRARTFALRDLDASLVEADIVTWLVNVGDRIVAGQPLLSVDSNEAIIELGAPSGGTIAKRCGAPGDVVTADDVLVVLGEAAADRGSVVGRIATAVGDATSGAGRRSRRGSADRARE